jgi:hypothetical protein
MSPDDEPMARAERAFQRRALHTLADRITDPALRERALALADGQLSAEQFVRDMARSAPAMRGFDRYLTRLAALTPAELEEIRVRRAERIDEIVAKFTATTPALPDPDAEQPWEDNDSWLE